MALKVNPAYIDAFYMSGLCEEAKSNYKEARIFYNQVLGLNASHELAKKGLARIK